jgi:hypothetical protein
MAALASIRIPLPQRDVTLYRSLRPENFGRDAESIEHPLSRSEIGYLLENGIRSKCDMSNIKKGLTCESVPKPECCDTTVEHHIGLNKPSLYISTSKNKCWTINYTLFNKVYKRNKVGIFVELCLRNTKFVDFTSTLSLDLLVKSSTRQAFAISAEEVLIVKPITPSEIKGIYMTEHVTREDIILELGYNIPKMSAGTNVQLLKLDSGVEFYYISTKNKEGKFSGKYFKVTKLWGPKSASPKSASPKSASPKSASPKSASPKSASPKSASPKSASPKSASPKSASLKSASPKKASPKKASPKKASPKKASPKSVSPI